MTDNSLFNTLVRGGLSPEVALDLSSGGAPAPTLATSTVPASISATYTQAEVEGLRQEVANLRGSLWTLIQALTGPGKPLQ